MHIFKKSYWLAALGELKNLRRILFAALICGVTVALDGLVRIPVLPGALEIKVTFFIIALGCAVYGPVMGALVAVATDTLSFFIFSPGFAYFPGYMLTEILVSVIYALFLYRQKITVTKLFAAKFCTNYFAHVLLNSLWASILMGKGYLYYFWSGLLKNSLLLPLEVFIMALFFGLLLPAFAKLGLLPAQDAQSVGRLRAGKSFLLIMGLDCLPAGACALIFQARKGLSGVYTLFSGVLIAAGIVLLFIYCFTLWKEKQNITENEHPKS